VPFDRDSIKPLLQRVFLRIQLARIHGHGNPRPLRRVRQHLHHGNDVRPGGGDILLLHKDAFDPEAAPGFDQRRSPDAARDEPRSPIPAVMKLRFARIHRELDVSLVVRAESMQPVRGALVLGQRLGEHVAEPDDECISFFLEQWFAGDSPIAEHVVRGQDGRTVKRHGGVGIQSSKHQFHVRLFQKIRRQIKGRLINPVLLANPLELLFVGAEKGIGDQPVSQEIDMHAPRHLGGMELVFGSLAERPVV